MERVLSDKVVVAKKTYNCSASRLWIYSGYSITDCETKDQKLIVEAAESDKWKILPGQKYRKVVGIHEGEFITYRARIGMDSVCEQLGLLEDN